MNFQRIAPILLVGFVVSACAYPIINQARYAEVRDIVWQVECELLAASEYFPDELDQTKDDKWDIGSTLDLTLVSRVDGDGKVTWAIPLYSSATPSIGGYAQDTMTAHLSFSTDLSDLKKNAARYPGCDRGALDPARVGLGLAAWIRTTFQAIEADKRGGLSYTKILELHADAGARFGYVFGLVNADVGAGVHGTSTNQLVVAITPHQGPQRVVIVPGKTKRARLGSSSSTFSNPNLINLLTRSAPVRLLPGQQIR